MPTSHWKAITDNNLKTHLYYRPDSDFEKLKEFIAKNDFTKICSFSNRSSVRDVLKNGGFQKIYRFYSDGEPPYRDHAQYFKNPKTKKTCLAYNPYADAEEIKDKVIAWAEEHMLEAEIYDSSKSWYAPSGTCFVVIHLPGEEIKV